MEYSCQFHCVVVLRLVRCDVTAADGSFSPCHVTDPDAVCATLSDIPSSQVGNYAIDVS